MSNSLGSIFISTNPSGKKVWKVELIVGTNPNGSKRTMRKTAHTRRDAERLRLEMRRQLEDGELGNQSFKKLDQFAIWWIRDIKARKVKASTAADYESRYRAYVKPSFGHRPMASITPVDITKWLDVMATEGYSDWTVNGALTLLKSMLKAAVKFGEIRVNPAEDIPHISNPRPTLRKEAWTRDEAVTALEKVRGQFLELPLLLGIHLGLRMGEVVGLKWTDMNFIEGTVLIQRAVREHAQFDANGVKKYVLDISTPKTRTSRREIALTQDLQLALLAQRERLEQAGHFNPTGWVLGNRSFNPVRPNRLAKLYKNFLEDNGLRNIRFHDLRHTAGTLGLEAGVRIEALSQDLGHSDISVTKRIYAPYVKALSREHSEAIQAHLRPEQNTPEISSERTKK